MSAKTKRGAKIAPEPPLVDREKLLEELAALGADIEIFNRRKRALVRDRDELIALGRRAGINFADLGRAAGIRRETAHYAAHRADPRLAFFLDLERKNGGTRD